MAAQDLHAAGVSHIPDARCAIVGGRQNLPAIGAEFGSDHGVDMPLEDGGLLTDRRVPEASRLVE